MTTHESRPWYQLRRSGRRRIRTALALVLFAASLAGSAAGLASAVKDDGAGDLDWTGRYAISGAIGLDQQSYHAHDEGGVIRWRNPDQSMSLAFGETVVVELDDRRLSWRLAAVGRGATRTAFDTVKARIEAPNRVVYRHGPVTDWYVNGPFGVQHGVTVAERPDGLPGPAFVEIEVGADDAPLAARVSDDGRHATIVGADGELMHYGRLVVVDADGRELPAHIETAGDAGPVNRLRIVVDDRTARYPLIIDPFMQRARLIASDAGAGHNFGSDVAIDGDVVVVGAQGINAVYVFERPQDGWRDTVQTARLTATNSELQFGISVAIDGDTIVAGDPSVDTAGLVSSGAVYVFVRPPGGWADATQTARLVASSPALVDLLGASVAIEGDDIVVGAPRRDVGGISDRGAVYVFMKPAAGWQNATESAVLTASDATSSDALGTSVAIDGGVVVSGATSFEFDSSTNGQGAVYVFEQPGGGWSGTVNQVARLTASDAASGANLGIAVDIDGETIVAGASGVEGTARFTGAAYVFTRPAGGWVDGNETAILTASDAAEADRLGTSIAISADIIVAATGNTPKAYVYRADGGAWTDATEDVILASDHSGVTSMHVAIEEETIVAGAPHALVAGNLQQGAAYVYQTCMSLQEPLTIAVNTWTMFGVPCMPEAPGTVESALGDDLDPARYTTRWAVYGFDTTLDDYVLKSLSDPLEPGIGYWIVSLDPASIDVEGDFVEPVVGSPCASPRGCFEYVLIGPDGSPPGEQYQMIGMPFPGVSIPWKDVRIVTPEGTAYTPDAAFNAQILDRHIFKYNGSEYDVYDATTEGMEGQLDGFDGIWIRTTAQTITEFFPDGAKLLIPVEPISLPPSP